MKLLIHTCCAPCSIKCIEELKKEDVKTDLYWYNPNIHPFMEYKNRLEALKKYSEIIDIKLIIEDEYGLIDFTKNVVNDIENRCDYCYKVRLEKTAKYAKENGYDAFSTTLLISPYQKHDRIKEICERLEKKYDIKFLYKDFRDKFREGQAKAKELELYIQKYCGCIYSEEERYR